MALKKGSIIRYHHGMLDKTFSARTLTDEKDGWVVIYIPGLKAKRRVKVNTTL